MNYLRIIALLFVLSLFTGISNNAVAQRLKVKQTNGKAFRKGDLLMGKVIRLSNHEYLSVNSYGYDFPVKRNKKAYQRGGYYKFTYMDDDLRLSKLKYPDFMIGDKAMIFEGLARMKQGFMIFLSYDNMVKQKRYLFAAWYDPESLTMQSDPVRIAEVKMAQRGYYLEEFRVILGEDEESFMVFADPPEKAKRSFLWGYYRDEKHVDKYDFWVYDDQLNLKNYRESYRLEFDGEKKVQLDQVMFDKSGSVYFLGAIRTKTTTRAKGKRRKKEERTSYEARHIIFQLPPDGSDLTYEPESEKLMVEGMMKINPDGKSLTFIGIEGEIKKDEFFMSSILYDVIELEDLSDISSNSYELPAEVLDKSQKSIRENSRATRSRRGNDNESSSPSLHIGDYGSATFDIAPDGTPVIIIEQKHVRVVTTTTTDQNGNTTTRTTYYYHYKDAIVCTIKDEEIQGVRIAKNHFLVNMDIGREITSTINGDKVYLIADDLVAELDIETNEVTTGKLQLSTASGRQKKTKATSSKRAARQKSYGTNIRFVEVYPISNTEFIAYQYISAKKVVMHKITF